ncbi:hypothetical protein PRK78_001440 [Emydomyces testavorans]|uniref:ER membrane protein complex subunit 1 n=1 Tax=Emydomyces testavorans TaxID=2070801 RepID=A0AAF0IFI3_9EURO|nr:hypothetical protein PRK78_001440 [Emydomyces testavorans]
MRLQAAYLFAASILPTSWAILADEAYHIDYHHALLGTPQERTTFFHRPSSSSSASLLYTLSEKSILGAVNPKDGSIVWRQNISDYSVGARTGGLLRAADGEDAVVSALGSDVLAWGASDGKLLWRNRFDDASIVDLELVGLQGLDGAQAARDSIVLAGNRHGVVRRLDGISGSVKWEYRDDSEDIPFQISTSPTAVYYTSLQSVSRKGYKIKVVGLDIQNGQLLNQYILHSDNEISSPESIISVRNNAVSLIAWPDQDSKALKVNIIGSKSTHSLNIENNSGESIRDIRIQASTTVPHFLVYYNTASKSWADVFHIDTKSAAISKAYQLPLLDSRSTFASNAVDNKLYFARITSSDVNLYSSTSKNVLGTWKIKESNGEPQHAVLEVVARAAGFAIRFAQVDESGDWILIRNGELEWHRPESLTDATVVAWAEVNGVEALAHELEFEGHQDVLSAYIHRVKRHVKALQENLLPWLQELPTRVLSSFLSSEGTDLTQFGFGKVIIVATRKGRVLAIDSGRRGAVLWNVKAADNAAIWGANAIYTRHDVATIFVTDGSSVKLNITSGKIIKSSPRTSEYSSMVMIPDTTSPIPVRIKSDGIPSGSSPQLDGNKILVTLGEDGKLTGWNGAQMKSPAWEFLPPNGQRIIHATSRPEHDPVASIGKVLGNRSVLYKYLNPNLALVTAVAGSTVTLYLLDGVSGQILYTTSQVGIDPSQPIASIISENWFAYSFWADVTDTSDAKGYRLVISELYESPIPNDRGLLGDAANYSSIRTSMGLPRPHVISQAYMIPEAISNMAVTETRQGITIRQLLCTLPASNAIVGIPRFVLDPRRPVNRDPTSQEAEEGLVRYTPFLDFDPKWYLNHAREVMGIRRIESSPTLLESSTLVFAYGFDVFGTRLAPSQPFDLLGKGFSKIQLLLTVVALAVGVAILAPLVSFDIPPKTRDSSRWYLRY